MCVEIQIKAKLPVIFKKKEDYIIAICPILDVMSQGNNRKEAKKNLAEALSLFFITCYEHGTLDEVLKQCGFKFSQTIPGDRVKSSKELIDFKIPLFAPFNNENIECHA